MDTSNIIKGVVNSGRYTVTAPIIKEDYGLYLQIEGVELPQTYEVDFSNSEHHGTSVTMIGNSDGVLIPHQFISTGKDIFAFLYHVGADYGRTVYKFRIPNKVRPDRTDDTPTPEQASVIDQAISALNEAVEQTAQDVESADASAQSASADAERAEDAKTDAQNFATQAEQSATSAQTSASQASASATASAQSASQSAQIKADVESLAEDVQGYANSAQQSASQASVSEQGCARAVLDAASAAAIARARADEASGYAQTASAKAQDASGYAQTASTKASEASQSATNASQSAQTAEQAKIASQTAQGLAEDARDDAQQAQAMAENAEANAESTVHGVLDSLELVETSGSIIETHDAFPVSPEKMVVDINPVQDTSGGDTSPENICPIIGWTGMNLRKCNANLWDDEWYSLGNTMTKIVDETSDFYGYYWGSVKTWANVQQSNGFTKLFPYGVDRLTVTAELGNLSSSSAFTFRIYFYYSDGTSEYDHNIVVASKSKKTETRVSLSGKKCTGFTISTSAGTGNPNGVVRRIMVSVNGVTDLVEPVQNPLIPINFQTEAGTVYGGKLDVLSGVMRVDRLGLDGGDLSWNKVDSYNYGNFFALPTPLASYVSTRPTVISSSYKSESNQSASSTNDCYVWIRSVSSSNRRIYVKDTSKASMTAEEFRTAMTGVQFVYELAEPIEIKLTPQQITLLKDYNALWADTGDISEFAYRAGEFATRAEIPNVPVEDVQVNGSSVVQNKIANIDLTGIEENYTRIDSLEDDRYKPYVVDSASGSIASFPDGADDIPLKSLVVSIDPVQDLSQGDPSPENICPIIGWTGCEVNATGYNIWDEQWESGGLSYGAIAYNTSRIRSKNYIVCKPNTTYNFNRGVNNGNLWVSFYDINKNYINVAGSGNGVNIKSAYTTLDNCHYMKFFLSAQTEYQHDVTINYPSTDHDYHPYFGQTIPINWQTEAGTVYGGKLDVLTGKLTVYPYYASYNGETLTGRWISDRDVYAVGTTPTIGAQVVNIGAEGTEYQLEPHEVTSLLGQNNIFADTGGCSVEYRADTKLYIEKLTQPEEDDMIADSAITSGQFFMVGNTLYRALANIASGATITVGTNAQRVSLSDALNLVNA